MSSSSESSAASESSMRSTGNTTLAGNPAECAEEAVEDPARPCPKRARVADPRPRQQALKKALAALDALLDEPEDLDEDERADLREVSFRADLLHYRSNLPKRDGPSATPLRGETLVARTWPELLRLLELNSWEHSSGKFNSPFLFRGLPNSAYELRTSLQRLGHPSETERTVEMGILRSFLNYCHGALDSRASIFEWLALAQHHGCPTRILDFSSSALIALHFAVRDPSKDATDGVMWCVDPHACMQSSATYVRQHTAWSRETGDSYWSVSRTNQMISLLEHALFYSAGASAAASSTPPRGLGGGAELFDTQSKIQLLDKLNVFGDSLVFMEAPAVHERVTNQNHVFAFLTGGTANIHDWLGKRPHTHRKVVIAKELKAEVRERLSSFGITERLLFPGLSGTSKWIRNKYTPVVKRANLDLPVATD